MSQNRKCLAKNLLLVSAMIVVLAVTACASETSSRSESVPVERVDPWEKAVSEVQKTLQNAPDFEDSLESHQAQAANVSSRLSAIGRASPLLRKVDQLEETQIPLVGNAWDVVVEAMDAASPGGGQALDGLVDILRGIEAFDQNLQQIQGLDSVVAASRAFRKNPSEGSLRSLDGAIEGAVQSLRRVYGDLVELEGMVSDGLGSIDSVQDALQEVARVAGLSAISDAVRSLDSAVDDLLQPLRELQDVLETWHQKMQRDIDVMSSIQRAVDDAER